MTMRKPWAFLLSAVGIVGAIALGLWIATFGGPTSHYKDVEVHVETSRETCWIVGSGARSPDNSLDGWGDCGSGGTQLSDDMTHPPSSIAITKTSEDGAELYAEFVVDGEVTDSGTVTAPGGSLYLSGH